MKLIGKIGLGMLSFLLLVVIAVLIQDVDPAQKNTAPSHSFADTLANSSYDLDSLKAIIGPNKGLPQGFEVAGAIAFSAYPELKDVEIEMVLL